MIKYFLTFLIFNSLLFCQSFTIRGVVKDSLTNEPLANANLQILENSSSIISDNSGKFTLTNVGKGIKHLKISYIGFYTKQITLSITSDTTLNIYLKEKSIILKESLVKGKYASIRETPVAFSNVPSEKIGARYLTDLVQFVPDVFISSEGGGFADSRLSIRGFDQTSIAVMINGIPINNPENGEVYWSNWGDLSDVVQNIQVQRGLSATPYSVSSIGGVVNILTKTSLNKREFAKVKSVLSSDNYRKYLASFSTSLNSNLNLTGMISRITSDGYADQTWLDAYSYYLSLGWHLKNQFLEIQIMGSPQKHGQRLTPQTKETWDKYGLRYNADWGYLNGKPLNLRDNKFHKPSVTINHIWQINDKFVLSNSLYLSYGYGGGTVPPYESFSRTDNGLIDFNKEWNINSQNIDSNYSTTLNRSIKALRFTKHEHKWGAFLSSAKYSFDNFDINFGLDGKYYFAENYSTLSNLLGGDYYIGSGNVNEDPNKLLFSGDKVDYDADSYVRANGSFIQIEHNTNTLNTYLNFSLANTGYNRIDLFDYKIGNPKRETGWKNFFTYTIKAGINYNIDINNNFYFNIGNYSKAPLSMNVFSYTNEEYSDVKNEKVVSAEVGYGYTNPNLILKINSFITLWKDKAFNFYYYNPTTYQTFQFNIYGAKALHRGIEAEGEYQLNNNLKINSMFSISMNKWLNDVSGFGHHEALPGVDIPVNAKIADLYVGGFPMFKAYIGFDFNKEISDKFNFYVNPKILYNANQYPVLDISDRNDNNFSQQSSANPDYYYVDLNFGITGKDISSYLNEIELSINIYNLLNRKFITNSYENFSGNTEFSTIWYGRERWMDISLTLNF